MLVLWEFQRLPEHERENVKANYQSRNIAGLAVIYRKYRIGPSNLSDCCAAAAIMQQTAEAIRLNFKGHEQPEKT